MAERSLEGLADLLQEKFAKEQELKEFENSLKEKAVKKYNEEHGTSISLEDYESITTLINKEKKEEKESIELQKGKIQGILNDIYQSLPPLQQSYMIEEKKGEFVLDLVKIAKVKYKPKAPFVCSDELQTNQEFHDELIEKLAMEMGAYHCLDINPEAYIDFNQDYRNRLEEAGLPPQNLPGILEKTTVTKDEVSIYKKRGK